MVCLGDGGREIDKWLLEPLLVASEVLKPYEELTFWSSGDSSVEEFHI